MSAKLFYVRTVLICTLVIASGSARANQPISKHDSLKQIIISCKKANAPVSSPDVLVVYEDQVDGNLKWLLKVKLDKIRIEETQNLSVHPKKSFSQADAWTGAPRFLKSFSIKTEHAALVVSSSFSDIHQAYAASYEGRQYFCALPGEIPDALEALQKQLQPENSLLEATNSLTETN